MGATALEHEFTFSSMSVVNIVQGRQIPQIWYSLDLPPVGYRVDYFKLFMLSLPDDDTAEFLSGSEAISANTFWQIYRNYASTLLSIILAKTSINGLLSFGRMYLFSEDQLRKFLMFDDSYSKYGKKVLDLGAGSGDVTLQMRNLFEDIYATEMSRAMRWRLQQKDIEVIDAQTWSQTKVKFDLITAFNLIDRHYNPKILLRDLRKVALRSDCLVIISLVLPVGQYVEFNPVKHSTKPDHRMNLFGSFEDQAIAFIKTELLPAGFEVVRWTKLPYLCEGDAYEPYYHLNDALFLVKPLPGSQYDYEESPPSKRREL